MVLPLLFGLLGSGLASSGMLGGIGALTAGAIGTGLGSAIETGDIGEGVSSGLMSFFGGKLLGGAFGAEAANASDGLSGLAGVGNALTNTTSGAALNAAAGNAAANTAAGAATGAQAQAARGGIGGLFGNQFADPTKALLNTPGALSPGIFGKNMTGAIGRMTSPQILPYVAGAQLPGIAGLAAGMGGGSSGSSNGKTRYERAPAPGHITRTPPPGYAPGHDPEFDYQVPIWRVQNMAEGGIVGIQSQDDKQIVSDAVAAIRGEIKDPRIPLGRFLQRFGEQALRQLVSEVEGGGMSSDNGRISGVGDGMSDGVPASSQSGDVALSDGEVVIPSDVVSHLGNGSTDAGSQRLQEMMDRVRMARTGTQNQPGPVDPNRMVPA